MSKDARIGRHKAHAQQRAKERYGHLLTEEDLDQIVLRIQAGKSEVLERKSRSVSVRVLEYKGNKYRVVYNSSTKTVSTFLPFQSET